MALSKITIQNLDENFILVAQFNPKEYTISKSVNWKEHKAVGNDFPVVHFTTGKRREVKMELFFDTYSSKENLQDYLKELEKFMLIIDSLNRPPILFVSWGKDALSFKCVLEQMERRYTMFLEDGTPVRAIVNVTFKEMKTKKKKGNSSGTKSMKIMVLKKGENILTISKKNNKEEWRKIAKYNKIDDPLHIPPGTVIKMPPE